MSAIEKVSEAVRGPDNSDHDDLFDDDEKMYLSYNQQRKCLIIQLYIIYFIFIAACDVSRWFMVYE